MGKGEGLPLEFAKAVAAGVITGVGDVKIDDAIGVFHYVPP
jgi:hypothetical protein